VLVHTGEQAVLPWSANHPADHSLARSQDIDIAEAQMASLWTVAVLSLCLFSDVAVVESSSSRLL